MSEILVKLMLQCGATYCDDTDMIVSEEELVKYTELLINEKNKEINQLKSQLSTLKAQNDIYRGALYDSN